MQKNVINVVTKVYKFLIAGLFFWWYLLKGLIVYGLYNTIICLFVTIDELFKDLEDRSVSKIFRETSARYEGYKLQSFFTWIYFAIISVAIYLVHDVPGTMASILFFVFLYLLLLGMILVTYTSYYLAYEEKNYKRALALAFVNSFKRPMGSIAVFFIVLICAYIGYLNMVVLIFIAPSLYGLVVKLILIKRFKD